MLGGVGPPLQHAVAIGQHLARFQAHAHAAVAHRLGAQGMRRARDRERRDGATGDADVEGEAVAGVAHDGQRVGVRLRQSRLVGAHEARHRRQRQSRAPPSAGEPRAQHVARLDLDRLGALQTRHRQAVDVGPLALQQRRLMAGGPRRVVVGARLGPRLQHRRDLRVAEAHHDTVTAASPGSGKR
jgi:hypothetical protein